MRWQPTVGKVAPVLHAPVSQTNFTLGPFAALPQLRQPIVEFKTRLHVNANIKPVEYGLSNIATKPKTLAQLRTRLTTPMTSTGAKGNPATATQSMATGRSY